MKHRLLKLKPFFYKLSSLHIQLLIKNMEQQFAEQIQNMLEDIELVLNHHIVLGDEEYKSRMLILPSFTL